MYYGLHSVEISFYVKSIENTKKKIKTSKKSRILPFQGSEIRIAFSIF